MGLFLGCKTGIVTACDGLVAFPLAVTGSRLRASPCCRVVPAAGRAVGARVSSCLFLVGLSVLSGASPLNLGLFSVTPESSVSYFESSPSWVKRYRISLFFMFFRVFDLLPSRNQFGFLSAVSESFRRFFLELFLYGFLGPFFSLLNAHLNYFQYFYA